MLNSYKTLSKITHKKSGLNLIFLKKEFQSYTVIYLHKTELSSLIGTDQSKSC